MEPGPPAEEDEQAPVKGSVEADPHEQRLPVEPTPLDMVKRYALPVVFVVAVFSMYFNTDRESSGGPGGGAVVSALRGPTMGTEFEVQVVAGLDPNAEDLLWQTVNAALEGVDGSMSTYKAESELSLLNAYAEPEPLEISPDLLVVLTTAVEVSEASGGAFDPTIGPLVDRWGFGPTGEQSAPTQTEIDALLLRVGAEKLRLDSTASTALKGSAELQLDLSAIAKGFAVDRVAEGIQSLGYTSWYVEIGGEIRTSGNNAEGIPWQVGIEKPSSGDRAELMRLPMVNMAVATSGDYRNWHEVDGQTISHTIDPRSGRPIAHGLASVSVLHASCMYADAWATALNVLGTEAGMALAEDRGIAVMFVQRASDGGLEEQASSSWNSYLQEHSAEPAAEGLQLR